MQASVRQALACFAVLLMTACTSIPEDELERLEAIEADWRLAEPIDDSRAYSLKELQIAAIRRNPGLTALFYQYKAALQRIILAGALDDPQVRFGYFIDSVETRVGPQNWKAGVSQTFPFYGKRDLRAEVALHEGHELRESLVEERLEIARDMARAYWDLYYLEGVEEATARQIDLLDTVATSIESRYQTGRATRADLLRIRMEIDRLGTELANLLERKREGFGRMNALLDREATAPCTPAFPDSPDAEEPAMPELSAGELLPLAREFGPVRVRAHRILRQEAAVLLAELGYFPDLTLGYDYISTGRAATPSGAMGSATVSDSGKDPQILGFGLNLPIWWNKNAARVDQAKDLLDAERASRRKLIRGAEEGILRAVAQAREAEQKHRLYVDLLIPQAEERLRLVEPAYSSNQVDIDQLVAAEIAVLDLRIMKLKSLRDREVSLAEVDYLTAGQLRLPPARPAGAEDIPEVQDMTADEQIEP